MVFTSEHNDYESTQTEWPALRGRHREQHGSREYAPNAQVRSHDRVGHGMP
jgi:hypothetical protein